MNCSQDKFSVFWYNEAEINHWSQKDFEQKAADFAAAGVNIVMTFSCTHFRWSFYPYRAKINAAIKRLTDACHKYNIRVVEHHSSHLTYAPLSQRDWDALDQKMHIRKGSINMFTGLREHLAVGDPEIAPGVYLSDCRQIDGRTGKYVYTQYKGYAHCYNNPHFRTVYFQTLEDVYATGVDGIMTDDVAYYGEGHGCTCKYCREKFQTETGYTLPTPAEWCNFYGNYQDKVFLEFLRFRQRSTEDFHRSVNAHFTSLGLKLLRPNYTTTTFQRNHTANPFESAGDLWTHVFQENMFSSVLQTAWLSWSSDAMHRSAMARKYNVDPMSMFYPSRFDNYYFSWALSRAWEHLLMATPEGGDLNDVELKFADYEKTHPRLAGKADCMAEVAFLEPRSSMDYTADALESSARPFQVWMQAATLSNRRGTILFEDDPLEKWLEYPAVVVAGAAMLTDEQLELMKRYCEAGGKLFIFGKFGIYRPDGSLREHPEKIFNFTFDLQELAPGNAGKFNYCGKTVELEPIAENLSMTNLDGDYKIAAQSNDGTIYGVSAMHDRVLYLAGGVTARRPAAVHYGVIISRWTSDPDREVPAPDYAADYLKRIPGKILEAFLNTVPGIKVNAPDYLASAYKNAENEYYLHLVNTADILQRPPAMVSHAFRFKNFEEKAVGNAGSFTVDLKLSDDFTVAEATGFSPEFQGGKELSYQQHGELLQITVPAGCFAGYLHIKLTGCK